MMLNDIKIDDIDAIKLLNISNLEDWMEYRKIESDGIYRRPVRRDILRRLSSDEKEALIGRVPEGNPRDMLLRLPCSLKELKNFCIQDGLTGVISPYDMLIFILNKFPDDNFKLLKTDFEKFLPFHQNEDPNEPISNNNFLKDQPTVSLEEFRAFLQRDEVCNFIDAFDVAKLILKNIEMISEEAPDSLSGTRNLKKRLKMTYDGGDYIKLYLDRKKPVEVKISQYFGPTQKGVERGLLIELLEKGFLVGAERRNQINRVGDKLKIICEKELLISFDSDFKILNRERGENQFWPTFRTERPTLLDGAPVTHEEWKALLKQAHDQRDEDRFSELCTLAKKNAWVTDEETAALYRHFYKKEMND